MRPSSSSSPSWATWKRRIKMGDFPYTHLLSNFLRMIAQWKKRAEIMCSPPSYARLCWCLSRFLNGDCLRWVLTSSRQDEIENFLFNFSPDRRIKAEFKANRSGDYMAWLMAKTVRKTKKNFFCCFITKKASRRKLGGDEEEEKLKAAVDGVFFPLFAHSFEVIAKTRPKFRIDRVQVKVFELRVCVCLTLR